MKKLIYTFLLFWLGIFVAQGQDYKYGNTYSETLHFTHSQTIGGNSKEYPYTFTYSITFLEGGTLQIDADLQWDSEVPLGAIDLMYVDCLPSIINKEMNRVNGTVEINTNFQLGVEYTFCFRIPAYGGDIVRTEIEYVAGSTNDTSLLGFSAVVNDITMNSAKIEYTVTLPDEYEGADVEVKMDEKTVDNPIILTDLIPNTGYDYELVAIATLEGKETLTKTINVNFTTLRDPSKEIHNYNIANGFVSNAYLIGENPETSRRNIPVSFKSDIIYNDDNTLTIFFSITGHENIVGFVAQVNIDDYSGPLEPNEGIYTYTTKKQYENGEKIVPFFYPAYNGGAQRIALQEFNAGEKNEEILYGDPVRVEIYTEKTIVSEGIPQSFCAYLVDENGNFILTEKPEISLEDNEAEAELEGDFITLNKPGEVTLVAKYEGLTAKQIFLVGTNLVSGLSPETCEHTPQNEVNLKNATDGNEITEIVFDCSETEEHTMTFDLGGLNVIELIKFVWEGAAPTIYSVTLSDDEGYEYIIDVLDGEGGVGETIRKDIYVPNVIARYIKITTKKAYNVGWGIKIKELEVYGNPYVSLDWTNIPADPNPHSAAPENVVPIYSNFYAKTNLPGFTANQAGIQHLETKKVSMNNIKAKEAGMAVADDEDSDEDTYKVILFDKMTIDDDATINVDEDVTGAKLFNIDIYSQTEGTIYISAVWDYKGVTEDTSDKVYKVEITSSDLNTWKVVNFDATDIGYGVKSTQYNSPITTISKLIISSDIPEFLVDNCYFAGDTPLSVDILEADGYEVEYYTLQGVKVVNPEKGIFIRVINGKAQKVVL